MKITNKYVFFWNGVFSQFYQARMVIEGIEYSCCEQYMMHKKALFFGDFETAELIMKATNPNDHKQLGRQVVGFDKDRWDKVCFRIVYQGNWAKFTQNFDLMKELMGTKDKLLVEASPYDQIWGIGMGEDEEGIENPLNWKGQNLLGWVLTLIKRELI